MIQEATVIVWTNSEGNLEGALEKIFNLKLKIVVDEFMKFVWLILLNQKRNASEGKELERVKMDSYYGC